MVIFPCKFIIITIRLLYLKVKVEAASRKQFVLCLKDESKSTNSKLSEEGGRSKQETLNYLCLIRDFTARWQQVLNRCSGLSSVIIV